MEELEKNETSTQAEENTVSLASAQALADALAKIEVYTPTTWVDNSSPDIDAEHLNKPEQAIKRVTDALNSAVDVIKDLQSQITKNAGDISTVNNNLSKYDRKKLNNGDNLNVKLGPYRSASNDIVGSLLNKPTQVVNGEVTIDWYPSNDNSNYGTQILRHTRDNTINIYFRAKKGSVDNWSEWINLATKDDLLISVSGTGPTDWTALETTGNMPFKIWNVTKASTSKGAPADCYEYGTLIALVATATGDRWRNTLIYIPDSNSDNKIYIRNGRATKWLAFSGTQVNSVP
nr:MAG TPA: hypothetical protein [Caudoviricetes sp.]